MFYVLLEFGYIAELTTENHNKPKPDVVHQMMQLTMLASLC